MARQQERTRRAPKERDNRRGGKKKICIFCKEKMEWVDYKDVNLLRRFMSDRGKIRARRVSGNCAQHQRDVAVAIKTSRELAMLPYQTRTVAERGGGRGPGRGGPRRNDGDSPRQDGESRGAPAEVTVDAAPELGDDVLGDEVVAEVAEETEV
jgi:small subunit ribosomal protein S18